MKQTAEEIMLKHGLYDYAQKTTIAKMAFAAGQEYAQQPKGEWISVEKELLHYFYYIGAADGIANSLSGGKPDFEKRYTEYQKQAPNVQPEENSK
jgi:hypothetical protein